MVAELEKVIRGLEHHKAGLYEECLKCPYHDVGCETALCNDALALLKEQVPHVMTAEEALTRRIGYLETRINGHAYRGGYVLVQTLEIMMGDSWKWELVRTINSAAYFYQDQYNRDFRLWSERPNDKKRKAVKWDD